MVTQSQQCQSGITVRSIYVLPSWQIKQFTANIHTWGGMMGAFSDSELAIVPERRVTRADNSCALGSLQSLVAGLV